MQPNPPITLIAIESVLTKALHKIRKTDNPSEQNSGIGLVNRASKMAKAYAAQIVEAKAQERFEKMQAHKLRRLMEKQSEETL
jgi:hypothetical protein